MPRNNDIQFRRGTSTEWSNANPVLSSGEPGFDITNDVLKIGDGSTSWTGLSEFAPFNTNLIAGTGISLVYNSGNSTLSINSSGTGGGLANIVEDLTPQLGGNLDLNSSSITGVGNINISGDITANTGNLDVLSFNVNNESVLTKGQISWDDTEGTMDIGLTDNTTIHIGSHRYFRIRNETGGTLYKGQVVYASGVHANGIIEPALYVADGTIREVRFMGVILEDVNHQNNGYAIDFGHLEEMDLDGSATNYAVGDETWVAGDILYVHPTGAGKLTKNEPKHSISVAIVLDPGNGNGNGRMFVRPASYGHLDDNHDVAVSGATNGQFLQYNSATDYWVPSSSGNFTTLQVNGTSVPTGVGTSNYVTKWTGANSLGSGIIYDDGTNVGIGTASPQAKLDVSGVALFGTSAGSNTVYYDAGQGLDLVKSTDSTDGLHFGDKAYSASNVYQGIKHLGMTGPQDYMMISEGMSTLVSAKAGGNVYIRSGGNSPTSQILLYSSEIVINENGSNCDFRVEGDTDQNLLFVDASTDRVGIGTSSPTNKLTVIGAASFGTLARTPNNADAAGFYDRIEAGGGTQATKSYGSIWLYNSSNTQTHWFHSYPGTNNYINNGGNFGIGTSSPSYKLDVVGTGNFSQNLLVNGTPVSVSGHVHTTGDITGFASGVADVVNTTLIAGTGIDFDYNAGTDTLTINTSGVADNAITYDKLSNSATEGDNVQKRVAKAWVNFNGTGTVAIRDDFNVSSITDGGTGMYTINFESSMPDTDYSAVGICASTAQMGIIWDGGASYTRTSSAYQFATLYVSNFSGAGIAFDTSIVQLTIFR